MGLRQIRLLGDPVLREKTHKVTRFNENLKTLVEDMAETMRHSNGVGLAAPQVGVSERIIVVETPEEEEEPGSGRLYAVVNPEIVRASQDRVDGIEGCLSIPGYVGEVTRHEAVTIKGHDLQSRYRTPTRYSMRYGSCPLNQHAQHLALCHRRVQHVG